MVPPPLHHHGSPICPPLCFSFEPKRAPLMAADRPPIDPPPPAPSGPIKGVPHPQPTPPCSSSLPSLHLLSWSASHTERHCRASLPTSSSPPHQQSARGEPATRVPAPPSWLTCLHGKPLCPGAAARTSSGELRPLATVRSTVDPWTSHPRAVYRPWTRSTIFLFKNKSKSNKSRTLTVSLLSFSQNRI
jgi:hypothetical protein